MKGASVILSIMMMLLTAVPCSDNNNICNTEIIIEQVSAHSHHTDHDDICSPLCVCSCCSISLTVAEFPFTSNIQPVKILEKEKSLSNCSLAAIDFHQPIWQPPKLV